MQWLLNWLEDTFGMDPTVAARVVGTIGLILGVVVARWLALRAVNRRVEAGDMLFRARKAVSYSATVVLVVVLVWIWIPFLDDLSTFLGLVAAGVAIALADMWINLAGWVYIMFRRPFRVGDRIEIAGLAGDVVDIRAFRFTLLEIRNWVGADQSTGRLVHMPNGKLFREPVANFTEGFYHLWHEIPVLVTFESDWEVAEGLLRRCLDAVALDESVAREQQDRANAARDYYIRYREFTPKVYVTVAESGVLLTGRVLVEARKRRGVEDAVWRSLLKLIAAEPSVELAYPTMRTHLHDAALRVTTSSGHGDPARNDH